jgi:hypothetical protein
MQVAPQQIVSDSRRVCTNRIEHQEQTMTSWQIIYNMGWEVGREAGRWEARGTGRVESDDEGRAECAARMIDLLQKRFGPIAVEIRECMVSADLKSLETWTQRTLEGRSLQSIFKPVSTDRTLVT